MKSMYEIFYRALGGKVQSKDGLSNLVQRQTGGQTQAAPTSEMYKRWSPEQRADWDR